MRLETVSGNPAFKHLRQVGLQISFIHSFIHARQNIIDILPSRRVIPGEIDRFESRQGHPLVVGLPKML